MSDCGILLQFQKICLFEIHNATNVNFSFCQSIDSNITEKTRTTTTTTVTDQAVTFASGQLIVALASPNRSIEIVDLGDDGRHLCSSRE